jgi:hypothetical protein
MASPHVAGAAALYLQTNPTATTGQVTNALLGNATTNHLSGLNGSPNLLLYVGSSSGGGGGGGGGSAPVASLTKSCNGFSCTFTNTSTGATGNPQWSTSGDGNVTDASDPNRLVVSYGSRQSGSVTVTVTNSSTQSSSATQNVTCNPRKCQ